MEDSPALADTGASPGGGQERVHTPGVVAAERITIASVVEGEGDVAALHKLLGRIANELAPGRVNVRRPARVPRSRLIKRGELESRVEAAGEQVPGPGGILVLIDADDDCPGELGPQLLDRARQARPDKVVAVVIAKREFEAWFLAAAPSLAGHCGLPDVLTSPQAPEEVRGAKEWLTQRMTGPAAYHPVPDQALLAAQFDLQMARERSDSFDKFWREVNRLLQAVQA